MKNLIIGVLIIIIIIGGIWFVKNKQPVEEGEPIKIGISTVLTGDFAAAGENMVNAARMAVDDINKNGGINGRLLKLLVEDAGWDSKTGLAAAQKLINVEGVKYIVGGTSSNGTLASAPLANEKKVLYLTPVTGGTNIDNAGEYIFRVANSDVLAGRDIATAMVKLGYTRVGVIAEVTDYTLDIKKTFTERVTQQEAQVVIAEEFNPGTTDFRTQIAKIKAAKPQALLVASQTGVGGAHLIKQMRELGLQDIPIFSDFTFVTNQNAKEIVGSFEGIYFADPAYDVESAETQAFFTRYQELFGKPSLIPFHAAATYDSVQMLAQAVKAVGDDSGKVHDWLLANVKNWKGIMGTYSLNSLGNSDLGFIIKVVKDGKFEEVKY